MGGKAAPRGLVCVFNRNRDSYQVPLALAEGGRLAALVTDFYAPAGKLARLLPGFLRRRRAEGLPRRLTRSFWRAFLIQLVAEGLRLPMGPVFRLTDAMLGRAATRLATQRRAALYAYHDYIPARVPAGVPLVVFVYHPLAGTELELIARDAARFPEVLAAAQRDLGRLARRRRAIDWERAAAVVCASGFTARSVIADGCDPAKIAVIPYGLPPVVARGGRARGDGAATAEFLFVGQGIQRKGLHHLVRAWQADPPPGARLTIVAYVLDPGIAALITDPSIRVLGYQSREDLAALFAGADVFAMPSLVEGFGLVYLEALAQGCHVLGTANTGLPDLRLDDQAATLVEPGDLAGLSRALHALAGRARGGRFDRAAIAAAAAAWTQADFRRAIAAQAAGLPL